MEQKKKIFLVEDDENFGSVLQSYLEINDYQTVWFKDGLEAMENFFKNNYHLCIIDIMLPGADGYNVAKKIKTVDPEVPIIFLTAKTLKEDVIKGYKTGADDYITKPFDSELLLYKMEAILKRKDGYEKKATTYTLGSFIFNTEMRTLKNNEILIKLSPRENALLQLLIKHKNQILSRDEALLKIWGDNDYFTARSMDVYISKIRKYLKSDPTLEIENIHSRGFILWVKKS
ncbi:MAG: response regulator transcription factor [Bacteroidota bacterium]|nr:response regulator transcription factor [Bacteroidota bacterium]